MPVAAPFDYASPNYGEAPLRVLRVILRKLLQGQIAYNEVLDGRTDETTFGAGYLKRPFILDGEGCVAVPDGPGLGIELDDAGMAEIMARPWSTQRG